MAELRELHEDMITFLRGYQKDYEKMGICKHDQEVCDRVINGCIVKLENLKENKFILKGEAKESTSEVNKEGKFILDAIKPGDYNREEAEKLVVEKMTEKPEELSSQEFDKVLEYLIGVALISPQKALDLIKKREANLNKAKEADKLTIK